MSRVLLFSLWDILDQITGSLNLILAGLPEGPHSVCPASSQVRCLPLRRSIALLSDLYSNSISQKPPQETSLLLGSSDKV